jgi:hypothetical protein
LGLGLNFERELELVFWIGKPEAPVGILERGRYRGRMGGHLYVDTLAVLPSVRNSSAEINQRRMRVGCDGYVTGKTFAEVIKEK